MTAPEDVNSTAHFRDRDQTPKRSRLAYELARQFLGISTVYKVLFANLLLAIAASGIALALSVAVQTAGSDNKASFDWQAIGILMAVGVPGAFLINLAVLQVAFRPLASLVRTMETVRAGDSQVRAHEGLITDPLTNHMIETFNSMLDELEASRRSLQVLAAKVVAAQEEERRRPSRDLHDNAGQILTLAVLAVNAVKHSKNPDELSMRVAEAETTIVQAADEIRRAALELRPIMLDDLGLRPALEWYTQQSATATGKTVELRDEGTGRRFLPSIEVTVYRLVQEAVTNAIKHAAAAKVTITLHETGDVLRLTVADDGCGFDPLLIMRRQEVGLGLFSMKERVTLLGGTLVIDSVPGQGTRVIADIPITA
jgi:two-component system sensor histidine kinase UhpB